ncbi:MAG TPA: tetratricopeptide repeat protein [Candidatus Acidoferrum sp.]|nr:tetratricopeptide repeat protein [Candidatus Acidoferrum sp.]
MSKFALTLCLLSLPATAAVAKAPLGAQQGQPSYTLPEYNAEQAAAAEKDPQAKIKLLDAFVAQYPNSTLMQYIYQFYYTAYYQVKNYNKAIEYADKLIALGDKADLPVRVQAIQARVQLFSLGFDSKAPDAHDQLVKQRDAALLGVKLFPDLRKVPNSTVTDDQVKAGIAYLQAAAGAASIQLKDYPAAIEAFKGALAINPKDAVSSYRLGLAYLSSAPPQALDGFWALARAIALKVPDDAKIRDYLRSRILQYEQPGCDNQVDAQLSELLQLAANSPDRPASYTIPSHDELVKISQSSTIITVINDLSGGGDKAKMTWLAICGAEFPEVVGKIIDTQKADSAINFMVFTSDNADQMQAATTANMSVKVWTAPPPAGSTTGPGNAVTPQPDVVRFQKDDPIRFSGALVSYDPAPFLLHWDQVKVDPTTIPPPAGAPKRAPAHKPAAKPE